MGTSSRTSSWGRGPWDAGLLRAVFSCDDERCDDERTNRSPAGGEAVRLVLTEATQVGDGFHAADVPTDVLAAVELCQALLADCGFGRIGKEGVLDAVVRVRASLPASCICVSLRGTLSISSYALGAGVAGAAGGVTTKGGGTELAAMLAYLGNGPAGDTLRAVPPS